jgi:hypothetical protein
MGRFLTRHENRDDEHLVWVFHGHYEALRHYLGTGPDSNPPLPVDATRLYRAGEDPIIARMQAVLGAGGGTLADKMGQARELLGDGEPSGRCSRYCWKQVPRSEQVKHARDHACECIECVPDHSATRVLLGWAVPEHIGTMATVGQLQLNCRACEPNVGSPWFDDRDEVAVGQFLDAHAHTSVGEGTSS